MSDGTGTWSHRRHASPATCTTALTNTRRSTHRLLVNTLTESPTTHPSKRSSHHGVFPRAPSRTTQPPPVNPRRHTPSRTSAPTPRSHSMAARRRARPQGCPRRRHHRRHQQDTHISNHPIHHQPRSLHPNHDATCRHRLHYMRPHRDIPEEHTHPTTSADSTKPEGKSSMTRMEDQQPSRRCICSVLAAEAVGWVY